MTELFQRSYGTIETAASCKYYFQGKGNTFKGFADSDEELVKEVIDRLVSGEHTAREDTVRITINGEVLTDTRCIRCNHESVEDESCYRINEYGDFICQSCHGIELPVEGSWFEYMLRDYEMGKENDEVVFYTKEGLSKGSDDETEDRCVWLVGIDDCVIYYTTAK